MSSRPLARLLCRQRGGRRPGRRRPLAIAPAQAATTTAATTAASSTWKPRPAQYTATTSVKDLAIPMSDGVKLRGDLTLPANADGTPIGAKVPVVVTITAYNKTVIAGGFGGTLAGADPAYLVKRGYGQLTVDARGTGSSEGQWNAFDKRENQDAAEVMTWAHKQPWSNGSTAMTGASYMGISQIFAAAGKPAGLKAIFPQVPAADVYRDVVASGGQIDSGFMPLWLGLVTATGLIPPAVAGTDPQSAIGALASHIGGAAAFTGPTLVKALAGQDTAYDGPFYAERSPINVIDKVDVPTFLVAGEYDLFQRGTPLLFEKLRQRGVPTKLIIGPWDHLKGSSGAEVGNAGYGPLNELQLRWFDHYVKGMPDKTLDSDIAPLTYFEQGTDAWRKTQQLGRQRPGRVVLAAVGQRQQRHRRRPDHRRRAGRYGGRAPDPGRRALHPLHQPVDRRHHGPEPAAEPVPRRQPAQRPRRRHLRLRAGDQGGPVPGSDQRQAVRRQRRRWRRDAVGRRGGRRARRDREAAHRRLAGHLPPRAEHREVALPRRQADPALPPVHEGDREAPAALVRWSPSTSRSSRPAPRSSRVTGCGSRCRRSTRPT